jgi:RNA 2',3'-cyclic 3'-phosphodiesterase
MSKRIFIAVDIDKLTRKNLAEVRCKLDDPRCRINWVAPENLHVTLKFLGDVEDNELPKICETIKEVVAQSGPVEFEIRGVSAIPSLRFLKKLRMLWAEVDEPTSRLDAIFTKIESALEPLGFPRENRPFSPHITLARIKHIPKNVDLEKTMRKSLEQYADTDFGFVSASNITVYTSDLTPDGPVYTPVSKPKLT